MCERCFLCISVVFCPTCHQCPCCCSKSACTGQTEPLLENLGCPRRQLQGHKNSQGRLHPSLPTPTSQAFLYRLFLVLKPSNKWRPFLDQISLDKYLKSKEIQNGDTRKHKDILVDRRIGHVHRFQWHFNIPVNPQSPAFSGPGSILPIQSSDVWSDHCTNEIHNGSQRSQTDGSK